MIERRPALHRLVYCAGVVRGELTSEGDESNFATNYLSRFALTGRLLPLLVSRGRDGDACSRGFALTGRLLPLLEAAGRPGEAARVVIIGGAAQNGTIHFDDVNLTAKFGTLGVIGQFCQATTFSPLS